MCKLSAFSIQNKKEWNHSLPPVTLVPMNISEQKSSAHLPGEAEVVVVGGGVRGSVITYSLAKAGIDVLQIEREALSSASSGANLGMINISLKRPAHYTRFSLQSAQMYPQLIEGLDHPVAFRKGGTVFLLDMEERARGKTDENGPLKDRIKKGENLVDIKHRLEVAGRVEGLEVRPISAAETEELLGFKPSRFAEALYCESDCWVNPLQLNFSLTMGAKKGGAKILTHCELTSIRVENGEVRSIVTNRGEVRTQILVLATGIHLPMLVRDLQIDIPIKPNRGHVLVTEAAPTFLGPTTITINDSGSSVILLQTDHGNLLVGTDHEVSKDSREVSLERIIPIAEQAILAFPILKSFQIIRTWAGVRPWPDDGLPIFERFDNPKGLYVISGHSGVTLAPITGRIVLDWITTGESSIPIDDYRLARFS